MRTGSVVPVITMFAGGQSGRWLVTRNEVIAGGPLAPVERVEVVEAWTPQPQGVVWRVRGVTSYERYVNRREREDLMGSSPPLGRPEATQAALIPIAKSSAWWDLPQDERRLIFEEQSHHIATGLTYLPAVARRLYHARDLGEPFDFLTWFEFAPAHSEAFEESLLGRYARPPSGPMSSVRLTSGWFVTRDRWPGRF